MLGIMFQVAQAQPFASPPFGRSFITFPVR
jgi:hypothetical protein